MYLFCLIVIILLQIVTLYFVFNKKEEKKFYVEFNNEKKYYSVGEIVSLKFEKQDNKYIFKLSNENIPFKVNELNDYEIVFVMPKENITVTIEEVNPYCIKVNKENGYDGKALIVDAFGKDIVSIEANKKVKDIVLSKLLLQSIDENGNGIYERQKAFTIDYLEKQKKVYLKLDLSSNYGISVVNDLDIKEDYLLVDSKEKVVLEAE